MLLAPPATTPAAPLMEALLLDAAPSLEGVWDKGRLRTLLLRDLLLT